MSVNSYLNKISSELLITAYERQVIDNHIQALRNKIISFFDASAIVEHFAFGSYTRKTLMPRRADNNSDVDYMVAFRDTRYNPQTYLRWLRDFAENKYVQSERYQSHPTIVLELSKIKIELVPAIKNTWDSFQIPAPASQYTTWLPTSPNSFNTVVTNKNRSENGQIRPLIRLIKYWNAQNGYVYSSFELEKKVTDHYFYSCSNLGEYFCSFVSGLSTFYLSITNTGKVNKLKNICIAAKNYEQGGYMLAAEEEIKKAIPNY